MPVLLSMVQFITWNHNCWCLGSASYVIRKLPVTGVMYRYLLSPFFCLTRKHTVLIISIKVHYHLTPANYLISQPSMKITFIIRMTSWTLFKKMDDSERFKIKSTFWLLFMTVEKLGLRLFTYKKFNIERMTARFINWLCCCHQFEEIAISRPSLTTHTPAYLTYSPETYVNCNMRVSSTPM